MRIRWYGQSAYRFADVVSAGSEHTVEQDGAGRTAVLHLPVPSGRD